MKENEYVVTFTTSVQITEDSWKKINPSMLINDNTTISDIRKFYKKYSERDILELKIIELE